MQAVQSEIARYHPKLLEQLKEPGAVKNFEDGVAIIATYLDIVLDGVYCGEDVVRLYEVFYRKLQDKRGAIVIL